MLPPSTTIRKYQRNLLSTTSASLGSIYCSILSFANTKNEPEIQEIYSSLVALRSKLEKSTALRANVGYEVCPALNSLLRTLSLFPMKPPFIEYPPNCAQVQIIDSKSGIWSPQLSFYFRLWGVATCSGSYGAFQDRRS